jgi:hypothetical protein
MSPNASTDVLIRIDTIDQLFNDPAVDPFSDKPAVILGEAALRYAVREELGRGLRGWHGKRLIIQLPADQITPDLQTQLVNAVRRYAETKRAENQASIRVSRSRSLVGLMMAVAIACVLLTLLTIATNTLFANSSDAFKVVLTGLVTIFIWSTVWNPWDRLIYEWLAPWLENRLLHNITTMEIVVQPEATLRGETAG